MNSWVVVYLRSMKDILSADQTVAGRQLSTNAKKSPRQSPRRALLKEPAPRKPTLKVSKVSFFPPEVEPFIESMSLAMEIARGSKRRVDIPIRKSFVRIDQPGQEPPLARIVSRGGRGGALAAKLYIALIWRCSAAPYNTEIAARKWAALLGLEDPNVKGARRIANALSLLADLNLVSLTQRRGQPSIIELLDESGEGSPYELPSTAFQKSKDERDRYFKVPVKLWTGGAHIQRMSSPALTMLLILLCEGSGDAKKGEREGTKVWWSTERFPDQYSISPAMRSRGTKELIELGLLYVSRQLVATPGSQKSFARERVRNIYRLQNEALVYVEETPSKKK